MNKSDLKKLIQEVMDSAGPTSVKSKHWQRNLNLNDVRDYREFVADKFEEVAETIRLVHIPDYPSAKYDAAGPVGGKQKHQSDQEKLRSALRKLALVADSIRDKAATLT